MQRKTHLFFFEPTAAILDLSMCLGKGSVALGEFFVYFTKKFVSADARRVRPGCFHLTKFCPTLPNFKEAGVLPRGSTIFLSGDIYRTFLFI